LEIGLLDIVGYPINHRINSGSARLWIFTPELRLLFKLHESWPIYSQ